MTSPVTKTASGSILPQVAAVLASLLAVASLPAQTAEAPAAAPAKDSDVVILSPFTVNDTQTHGYQATNSIGATRSSTPIKDVPLNIQVFTKELAEDIAATSQIDLERYNAALVNGNGDSHSSNAIQQAYNAFLFRGFVQNWGLRDGIREYDPVDVQGIARVELVKGPAAPLYGLAYAGGIMNVITKQVDFSGNFADLHLSAQTYGEYRAAIDANYIGNVGKGGKFGVRVNAARTNSEDERDHSTGMSRFTQLNLAWMPTPQTEIKFLGEQGYRARPALLTGNYFLRAGANGAQTPLQIVHPDIPWTWNTADKYNVRDDKTMKYRGTITQSIGENFSVTAYVETNGHNQVDSNGWDAAGTGGSNASWDMGFGTWGAVNTGWMQNEDGQEVIREAFHTRSWNNRVHAYGATAVYKVETGPVKNTFTVGGNAWAEAFYSVKGNTSAGSTQIIDFPISTNINPDNVPEYPGTDFHLDPYATSPKENSANDYYFVSWQGSMLENRLKLNVAVNKTNIKLVQHSSPTENITKLSKTSPMFGAMFDITKEISVFAVHSTSVFPVSDKDSYNHQMPPNAGKSNEGGFKVDLLGGKISGTISYYEITQTGGSQFDATLVNRGGTLGDTVPGGTQTSKGIEADMVFQPTPEWQVMLSFATNDQKTTSALNHTLVGHTTTNGHIKQQTALLTKYTFAKGPVSGLSVGMGLQASGKSLQGFNYDSAGTVYEQYFPRTFYAEVFAGYKFKAFGYDHKVQLNLKNLTKQEAFSGWYQKSGDTWATTPYKVPTKMIWNLSYDLMF